MVAVLEPEADVNPKALKPRDAQAKTESIPETKTTTPSGSNLVGHQKKPGALPRLLSSPPES